jgi:hypothetical protein
MPMSEDKRVYRYRSILNSMSHGAAEFPKEMVWLWRDYDASKTSYTYEMEPAEKSKPLFRVSITNREAQ